MFLFLFAPKLTSSILVLRQTNPEAPPSYSRTWNFKTAWDTREDVLRHKYLELLDPDTHDMEPIEPESPKQQAAKANINVEDEFRNLARFIGVVAQSSNIELEEFTKLAPLKLLEDFKRLFTNKGDFINDILTENNQIRNNFLSFLLSRDDNMIMLTCTIIDSALNPPPGHSSVPAKTLGISRVLFERAQGINQVDFEGKIQERNETCRYILDCLYKLLNVDPPFRLATMRIVASLIIDLSETRNDKLMISEENLLLFNAGYRNSINKVLKFLQNSMIGEIFADLFEMQWKELYKKALPKLKKKDYVYTLVPVMEDMPPNLDFYLRIPMTECELAKKEISVFLLFRKIRYSLVRVSKDSKNFDENYRPVSSKENLSNSWEEGKIYEMQQRKMYPCHLKEQGNKQVCYVVEDDENFIVMTPDTTNQQLGKILINTRLKSAEALIDRVDSQTLTITLEDKGKYHNKNLKFSDQKLCLNAKRTIDEKRKVIKHYEMSFLLKNFENAKNDIYELPLVFE